MNNDSYSHPQLDDKLRTAEKSSSLFGPSVMQASMSSSSRRGVQQSSSGGGNGDSNMFEARIARLESDVENIKTNLSETRSDVSRLRDTAAGIEKDVAVVLHKVSEANENLSKKPSKSEVESLIASAVNKQIAWTVGIGFTLLALGLGIAKLIF